MAETKKEIYSYEMMELLSVLSQCFMGLLMRNDYIKAREYLEGINKVIGRRGLLPAEKDLD